MSDTDDAKKERTLTGDELYTSCRQIALNPLMRKLVKQAKDPSMLSDHLKSLGWSADTCRQARHAVLFYNKTYMGGAFDEICRTKDRPLDLQFKLNQTHEFSRIRSSTAFVCGEEIDDRSFWPWLLREQKYEFRNDPNTFDGLTMENSANQALSFTKVSDPLEVPHQKNDSFNSEVVSPSDSVTLNFMWQNDRFGKLQVAKPLHIQSMIVNVTPQGKILPEFWKQVFIEKPLSDGTGRDNITVALRLERKYTGSDPDDEIGYLKFERFYPICKYTTGVLTVPFRIMFIQGEFIVWWVSYEQRFFSLVTPDKKAYGYDVAKDSDALKKIAEVAQRAAKDYSAMVKGKVEDNKPEILESIAGIKMVKSPPTELIDLFT